MQDRHFQIHLSSVLAAISGCVGVGLVVANFFILGADDELGIAGIVFVALAATLRIRSWFVRMAERERQVFQMGRDSVRSIR